jgi:hypothetical protein
LIIVGRPIICRCGMLGDAGHQERRIVICVI